MTRVLHVLPHRGGGAETYIDVLAAIGGFEHDRIALSAGRSPASAAASLPLRWPRVAHAARRADLVHAHGDVAAALALPLLAARPSVATTHGLHFLRRAAGPWRSLAERALRAVVRATARTLCTSQAERDELAALVGPQLARRLAVVHNGVELAPPPDAAERAAIRAELALADGDVAALFLGELHERKAPLVAVAAARAAAQAGAPVVLLVAGDGPQAAALRAQAGPAVRALGFRADPTRLLAAADVFVLPSTREGLSFALLEAMAAGLALVVSDGAGNPEAVGDAGVVVPAGDSAALAAALERLARDGDERRRLGAAARERARTHFSRARMLDGVAAAYAAALP
ncbi:MAG TPA: glycosyltransferase family 4 protein [Solirubrobacteraceae bacterium]|nr:glycosyltransferase family 4 protein [Solirubrobacteraceae bacterium]